jgi:hypothetical protein
MADQLRARWNLPPATSFTVPTSQPDAGAAGIARVLRRSDPVNVTVETRSYMSAQHLWAAQHYVRLAQDFERERAGAEGIFIRHRSYVFTAVSEAVAFLEAFINRSSVTLLRT